jgi:hypothetical protein
MKDISRVPKKYENGHRKLNIVLTKLRCSGSFELVAGGGVSEPLRQQDTVHTFIYISTCLNIFCSVHLGVYDYKSSKV